MALNIRNPVTEQLADELAALTGESKTEAVKKALEERLTSVRRERRKGKASVEELQAIAKRAAAHLKHPHLDHAELLYDDRGLPT